MQTLIPHTAYLQQRLGDRCILWMVKVQKLGAEPIEVGPHFVEVHDVSVCTEHSPPSLLVHLGKFHG